MAGDEKGKTALAVGVGIGSGALAALLMNRSVSAEGLVHLDEETMQALISLLQHSENMDADLDTIIELLGGPAAKENPPNITAFTVYTAALATPVQLPDRSIPYDMTLVIKAMHTNTGVICVGPSMAAAMNANSSYWLIANEAIEYKIKNADHIYICCHPGAGMGFPGDGVVCTVEQK